MAVLSSVEALILQSLVARGELYGAELVRDSGGKIKRGTVYVTLQRMEDKGLVESKQEQTTLNHIGLPRRRYKATGVGAQVLSHWTASVQALGLSLGKGEPAW